MIELLVVLVIIAIVVGFGAQVLLSPKKAASKRSAAVAARAYGEAIAKFQADHGGRPPRLFASSREWPSQQVLDGPRRPRAAAYQSDKSSATYMDGGRPENVGPGQALDFCSPPTTACQGTATTWRAQYQVLAIPGGPAHTWRLTLNPPTQSGHRQCEIAGTPGVNRPNVRDCP